MRISLIAAISKNYAIGSKNQLLWRLPDDMKFFKSRTVGRHVLMGRKTYESFPEKYRPLPDRVNIVITSNKDFKAEGCVVFHTILEGIQYAYKENESELMIIGGGEIYRETIDFVDTMYLTLVNETFPDADTFYPPVNVLNAYSYLVKIWGMDDANLKLYNNDSAIYQLKSNYYNKNVNFCIRRSEKLLANYPINLPSPILEKRIHEMDSFMTKFLSKHQHTKKKANLKDYKWLINPIYSKLADEKHKYDFDILELRRVITDERNESDVLKAITATYALMEFIFDESPSFLRMQADFF